MLCACKWISSNKPANAGVVIPGTQVVEPGIRIVLLAGVEIVVFSGSGLSQQVAEGITGLSHRVHSGG